MEFTKQDMKITKGVAILFMLLLHLFARKEVNGLYNTFPVIHGVPLMYYIGLFGDACVPMFCFASGYGLFISINQEKGSLFKKNFMRIFKLLINYWIILLLFVAIGLITGKGSLYPGSVTKFVLNFLVLSNSYNGAWWFLQTYIILVFFAPSLFRMIKNYNSYLLILISGVVYLITYIQRIKHVIDFGDNTAINMLVNAIVLVGTSQLPFIIGAIFAKDKIYSRMALWIKHIPLKNYLCASGILLLILIHSFYESMIIAPITGIAFICFFNLIDKKQWVKKTLDFIGKHSTNIWLTHMFFYMTIFPQLVFAPKYPVLIFCWLMILCLLSSYIINLMNKPLTKMVDKKSLNWNYSNKRAV